MALAIALASVLVVPSPLRAGEAAGPDQPAFATMPLPALAFAPGEEEQLAVVAQQSEGAELEQAREFLERLIADDLRDAAHITRTRHQIRLVAAAQAGSLSAAARLVDLGWREGMRQVSTTRPAVAAWKDDDRTVAGLRAGQVYAQLWIAHRLDPASGWFADYESRRAEWLRLLERWPVTHPMLLAQVLKECGNVQAPLPKVFARYQDHCLVAFANDPLYAGDDVQAMFARGEALARCSAQLGLDSADAVSAIFDGAAARCAQRGLLAGAGINHFAKCQFLSFMRGPSSEVRMEEASVAANLLARAGDYAHLALCRSHQVIYRMIFAPGRTPTQLENDAYFLGTIEMCRANGDWFECARLRERRAYRPLDYEELATANLHRAQEWEAAAQAFAAAREPEGQGNCLYTAAGFLVSALGPGADHGRINEFFRRAEACFTLIDEQATGPAGAVTFTRSRLRMYNLFALAEGLWDAGDTAGAHAMFTRLGLILRNYPAGTWATERQRLARGLQANP